jgi:hypothetical protein
VRRRVHDRPNWTPTCQTQIHKPNPYSVEEEKESVDGEFQESEFIDEEFRHEDVSQGLVDWDFPPTYDDDVNEEDPIEEPLASDLEEEYKEYGLSPMFGGIYLEEEDQLKEGEYKEDGFFFFFFFPCLVASTPTKMTNWKMKSSRMTLPIMKKMTSPMMKRLMKTFQVKCLILMVKMLITLIGFEDILYSNNITTAQETPTSTTRNILKGYIVLINLICLQYKGPYL